MNVELIVTYFKHSTLLFTIDSKLEYVSPPCIGIDGKLLCLKT